MSEYPKGSTARIYYDSDQNPTTLYRLVISEPDWAVSRIKHCEDYEQLQATVKQQAETIERLRAALTT